MSRASKQRRKQKRAEVAEQAQVSHVDGEQSNGEAEGANGALTPPTPTDSTGGLGDRSPRRLVDPANGTRDIRLLERAARTSGWEIPVEAYTDLPAEMLEIACDRTRKDRIRAVAAKVVLGMHGQNLSTAPRQVQHLHANVHTLREELLGNETVLEECRTNRAAADTPAVHYENPEENRGNNADGDDE